MVVFSRFVIQNEERNLLRSDMCSILVERKFLPLVEMTAQQVNYNIYLTESTFVSS